MEFKFDFKVDGFEEDDGAPPIKKSKLSQSCDSLNQKKTHNKRPYKCISVSDIKQEWKIQSAENLYLIEEIQIPSTLNTLWAVTPCDDVNKVDCTVDDITGTDLLSAVYEGGFKIWECTLDLIKYLEENSIDVSEKSVLDMGCGVGLLGIYVMLKGNPKTVHFQDYNSEVITKATGPSVLLNSCHQKESSKSGQEVLKSDTNESDDESSPCDFSVLDNIMSGDFVDKNIDLGFFSGDWDCISDQQCKEKSPTYDVILSAETIYNPEYYVKIHRFLEKHLAENGVAYFGSKSHYFGVGGGVASWLEFVREAGVFEIETAENIEDYLHRSILKLVFKK